MVSATRKEALANGDVRYRTGEPCLRGHMADRFAKNGQCSVCTKDALRQWRKENAEAYKNSRQEYRDRNRAKKRELERLRYWADPEKSRAKAREKKRLSPETSERLRIGGARKKAAEAGLSHYQGAPCVAGHSGERLVSNGWCVVCAVATVAARRAKQKHRTPAWADLNAVKKIYDECPKGYHVDHIIPLAGRRVSGLHVAHNLQYLPAAENLAKGNRYGFVG